MTKVRPFRSPTLLEARKTAKKAVDEVFGVKEARQTGEPGPLWKEIDECCAAVAAWHPSHRVDKSLVNFGDRHLDRALEMLQDRVNEIMDEQQRRVDDGD